jgi:hypothetical protein
MAVYGKVVATISHLPACLKIIASYMHYLRPVGIVLQQCLAISKKRGMRKAVIFQYDGTCFVLKYKIEPAPEALTQSHIVRAVQPHYGTTRRILRYYSPGVGYFLYLGVRFGPIGHYIYFFRLCLYYGLPYPAGSVGALIYKKNDRCSQHSSPEAIFYC